MDSGKFRRCAEAGRAVIDAATSDALRPSSRAPRTCSSSDGPRRRPLRPQRRRRFLPRRGKGAQALEKGAQGAGPARPQAQQQEAQQEAPPPVAVAVAVVVAVAVAVAVASSPRRPPPASNRARRGRVESRARVRRARRGRRRVGRTRGRPTRLRDRRSTRFLHRAMGASIRYFRPRSIARANSRTVNAQAAPASRRRRARVAAVRRSVGRAVARSRGRAATAHRATTTTTRATTTR